MLEWVCNMSVNYPGDIERGRVSDTLRRIIKLCMSGEIDKESHLYLRWLYLKLEDKPVFYRIRRSWKLELNHIEKYKRRRKNQRRTR